MHVSTYVPISALQLHGFVLSRVSMYRWAGVAVVDLAAAARAWVADNVGRSVLMRHDGGGVVQHVAGSCRTAVKAESRT